MELLSSVFSPLLTVYSSERANQIAQRNGLCISELLEPFLLIRGKIVTPTMAVDSFSARLRSSKEPLALSVKPNALESLGSYIANFLAVRVSTEHETFNHPVAALVIVSTADSDPMAEAFALYNESTKDSTGEELKLYILLHDTNTSVNADSIYSLFKKKTNLVYLIKLNCQQESVKDYWAKSVVNSKIRQKLSSTLVSVTHAPPKLQKNLELTSSPLSNEPILSDKCEIDYDPSLYGKNLSKEDIENIRTCMRDFVAYQVITYMGEQIIAWDRDVITFLIIDRI